MKLCERRHTKTLQDGGKKKEEAEKRRAEVSTKECASTYAEARRIKRELRARGRIEECSYDARTEGKKTQRQ